MSETDPERRLFASKPVIFDVPGMLGAGTNGALPDQVDALVIAGDIRHEDGEVTYLYSLRAVTTGEGNQVLSEQDLLTSGDGRGFVRLLSTMHDVASRGVSGGIVEGDFKGLLNLAQVDFDPVNAPRDDGFPVERAWVGKSPAGHLEVDLRSGTGGHVARLDGMVTRGVDELYRSCREFVQWAMAASEELEARAETHRAASAPSP